MIVVPRAGNQAPGTGRDGQHGVVVPGVNAAHCARIGIQAKNGPSVFRAFRRDLERLKGPGRKNPVRRPGDFLNMFAAVMAFRKQSQHVTGGHLRAWSQQVARGVHGQSAIEPRGQQALTVRGEGQAIVRDVGDFSPEFARAVPYAKYAVEPGRGEQAAVRAQAQAVRFVCPGIEDLFFPYAAFPSPLEQGPGAGLGCVERLPVGREGDFNHRGCMARQVGQDFAGFKIVESQKAAAFQVAARGEHAVVGRNRQGLKRAREPRPAEAAVRS